MNLQLFLEFVLFNLIYIRKLDCKMLTLDKELLLLLIILAHNFCTIAKWMLIGAILIQTLCFLKEKLAVFRSSKRGPNQSTVINKLIYSQNSDRGLLRLGVSDISRVTDSWVIHLEGLLFINSDLLNLTVLTKEFKSSKCLLFGYSWRKSNDIKNVLLKYSDLPKLGQISWTPSIVVWNISLLILRWCWWLLGFWVEIGIAETLSTTWTHVRWRIGLI